MFNKRVSNQDGGKEKKIKRGKQTKAWKILNGTYKKSIGKEDVEWLIAGIQQECYWTDRDVETSEPNSGKIDWREMLEANEGLENIFENV